MKEENTTSISLNKYISDRGICSRREATTMIAAGRVTVNNVVCKPGNRVNEGDIVRLDGKLLHQKAERIYLAFNKPIGLVCTTDPREKKNIVDYINHPQRLFPIGRLDKPSQGLIFLTNDGDIVNKILRAGNNHEKEYVVTVKQKINKEFITKMANGVPILGTVTKPCKINIVDDHTFSIILVQGLNRQIRRMCEYCGYEVDKLKRTRIMNITLEKLKVGAWRQLTAKEVISIEKLIAPSSNDKMASVDTKRKTGYSTKRKSKNINS